MLYVLLIMIAVMSTVATPPTRTISYTEFKQKVRANEVQFVVITESRIRGP